MDCKPESRTGPFLIPGLSRDLSRDFFRFPAFPGLKFLFYFIEIHPVAPVPDVAAPVVAAVPAALLPTVPIYDDDDNDMHHLFAQLQPVQEVVACRRWPCTGFESYLFRRNQEIQKC